MEKVKKYNQIILAIGGTIALVTLAGLGLFFLVELWGYYSPSRSDYDTSILSEEVADSLATNEQIRTQIITFSDFRLIDSAAAIYVLPVGQKNLGEEEYIDEGLLGLTNSSYDRRKTGRRAYYGKNHNNLILFGPNMSEPKTLFTEKVSVRAYHYFEHEATGYLLVVAADADTNGDGALNAYDLQGLHLYNIQSSSFVEVKAREHSSFIHFAKGVETSELIFQYGIDRNQNGEFEDNYEPKLYYRLNMESREMELLLSEDILQNLQNILEGSI